MFNFQQGRAADAAFDAGDQEAFELAQRSIRDFEIFLAQFAETAEETALRVARANAGYDDALVKFTDTTEAEAERLAAEAERLTLLNQQGYDTSNRLRAEAGLADELSEGRFDDARLSVFNICPNTPNTCLLYTSPSPRDS